MGEEADEGGLLVSVLEHVSEIEAGINAPRVGG
jgi:hypothetical protein